MLDEARRLRSLRSYGILGTPRESEFDEIAKLLGELCGATYAAISFFGSDRIWVKAIVGLSLESVPIAGSICRHSLASGEMLVIDDLAEDDRTRDCAFVNEPPYLRFYANALLRSPDGLILGLLCVASSEPRPGGLTGRQRAAMNALARRVEALLWLRRAMAREKGDAASSGRSRCEVS
ncbi:GAF domain-containing protein [Methylopila henanensis]|uniref:GAF domain-containing protein n=1 Tax=Methylopila henanensis TaxID=873516 RepID=A0ABW4KA32_9HYPH